MKIHFVDFPVNSRMLDKSTRVLVEVAKKFGGYVKFAIKSLT